jgi:pentapeptide MXKDX repeat protein
MTKRSRIGLSLLAASVGLGLVFAPAAYAASHEKKDKMMEKTDKMSDKNMKKDKMKKEDAMKKDKKM